MQREKNFIFGPELPKTADIYHKYFFLFPIVFLGIALDQKTNLWYMSAV